MSAIEYAITYIKRHIPREILEKTFISNLRHMTLIPISAEARIREKIIMDIVMKDIDIIGGTHITIPLAGLEYEMVENNAYVVRIPKRLTQGRSILTALSVSLGGYANEGFVANPLTRQSEVGMAAQQMLASVASIPYVSEAQVMLIAENTVLIQGHMGPVTQLHLRCEVENDANLNNLKRRSYFAFAELCLLACKAYIFTNNAIPMDIGYYEGGATIGRYKEIIDSYDSAQEEYTEYLKTKWARVSKLNDHETVERLVRLTTGGNY